MEEDLSKEKTEELIKDLFEEEKNKKEEKKSQKFYSKRLLIIIGSLLCLFFLALGFLILNSLFKPKTKSEELLSKKEEPLEGKNIDNSTTNETLSFQKIYSFNRVPAEKSFPFKLELKNFLLPLDENSFLKLDVIIYFENQESYRKSIQEQDYLREFFTKEINKKRDVLFWKSMEKIREYEASLKDTLNKESFSPAKLELDGLILRM